jgi:two-component system, chemotaxis family, protein-glutamate methylesterase/glutaminase
VAPRLVAIGTSAGGIEALHQLLPLLEPRWGLAYAIVLHRAAVGDDERLESLLHGWSSITVRKARNGEPVAKDVAVIAPPDVHLAVDDGRYRLTTGPRENHSRPAIDVLFRSVGEAFGARGAGIVLSGLLDDGAAGIRAMRSHGSLTIAQQPDEAIHSGMPRSAIEAGAEHVARIDEMPGILDVFADRTRAAAIK